MLTFVCALLLLQQPEPPIREAWVHEFEDAIYGAPQGAGDLVYVATQSGTVVAFKADTGERAWTVETRSSSLSHIVVLNGRLFVPGWPGASVLDAKSGKVLKDKIPNATRAIAGQSKIYLLDALRLEGQQFHLLHSKTVAAFEPSWTKAIWQEEFREGVVGAFESGSRLYVCASQKIVALDSATGRKLGEEPHQLYAYHGLADGGRLFFIGSGTASILQFDPKSLKEKWRFNDKLGSFVPPAIVGGRIILTWLPDVVAVDVKTGKEAWRVALEGKPHFSTVPPAVRGNEIYVGNKGVLHGVDAAAGKATWFLGTGGIDRDMAVPQPVWIGDRLYYAVGRKLMCFKLKS